MSCNLEFLGVLETVNLPASPVDFVLETADDLGHAYREYAKYNDERLVFQAPQLDLSPAGRDALFAAVRVSPAPKPPAGPPAGEEDDDDDGEEYWSEMFGENNLFASHEATAAEGKYWEILRQRIDVFVATAHGREQAQILHEDLADFLLSNFFYEGPLPTELYERVVATELRWRAQARATHQAACPGLYQREPAMEVDIIASFNEDKTVRETEALRIPATDTFEQFGELLCHQSGIRGATEEDVWYYPNPLSEDVHSHDHFLPITEGNYPNLKSLLGEVPQQEGVRIRLPLWHETQIMYVGRGTDEFLPPNAAEVVVDEFMREVIEQELDEAVEMARQAREAEVATPPPGMDGDEEFVLPQHLPQYRPRS